ncbi:MAG: hypothetical protein IKB76_06965, partial [Kiritimatiellae bacterium]|nr:hypothetical protein [Kiritimatiellia bacterium]
TGETTPKEKTTPKKVEDRLSRMLSSDGLEAGLHGFIASEGDKKVHRDTLIILDPSDVQKPYVKKTDSSFPLPDFHLAQNENSDFTLCLQECRCFSLQKIGEPPRNIVYRLQPFTPLTPIKPLKPCWNNPQRPARR